MYGTRFAMIQRSAPDRSIRLEVVVVKPRNSPNSTTTSTTANTIPVRVTANRTLSWTRFRQASIDMCPLRKTPCPLPLLVLDQARQSSTPRFLVPPHQPVAADLDRRNDRRLYSA